MAEIGLQTVRRQFDSGRLVIASHNRGKVREIQDLLRPYAVSVISAADLSLPEPEETGDSFVANAELKARAAAGTAGLTALADDSGLVVPALGGAPGIHSARWAGPERDFAAAMERISQGLAAVSGEISDEERRRAHFSCVLTLAWPDGHCESFEGIVRGTLVFPPRGVHGFGYDPIFIADGQRLTFGEMDPDAKHRISHRADAFAKLISGCFAGRPLA